MSDIEGSMNDLARALERLPTREERLAEEERRAWDGYFRMAAHVTSAETYAAPLHESMRKHYAMAAEHATYMLELRRKRFVAGKEADGERRVSVTVEVLMRVIETLAEVDTIRSEALRATLRALVSE